VVLLEFSKGMLEVARRKVKERELEGRVSLVQGDIQALEFPDEHFDLVLAEGVLEYCADLEQAFRELVRVLKPGGHLVASVDSLYYVTWAMANSEELDEIPELLREKRYLEEEGVYCNALTLEDFRVLAERRGLEVVALIGKPLPYRRHTSLELSEAVLALYAAGVSTYTISRFLKKRLHAVRDA